MDRASAVRIDLPDPSPVAAATSSSPALLAPELGGLDQLHHRRALASAAYPSLSAPRRICTFDIVLRLLRFDKLLAKSIAESSGHCLNPSAGFASIALRTVS